MEMGEFSIMPIHEFKCKSCNKVSEKIVGMNTDIVKCYCGGIAKKIISSGSFILKGGGWYADGYSKEKPEKNETK